MEQPETFQKLLDGWQRPDTTPYPKIWTTFERKMGADAPAETFIIQDVPEEMFDDVVDFMTRLFLTNEPLCVYLRFFDDETSKQCNEVFWRRLLAQHLSLVCLKSRGGVFDEIVACNILYAKTRENLDLNELTIEGDAFKKLFAMFKYVSDECEKVSAHLDQTVCLSAMGLMVDPKHQGSGIAVEMLKARFPMCRELGIPVTITVFTNIFSQKSAVKAGFNELYSIAYDELAKVDEYYKFEIPPSEFLKIMFKVV